MMAMARSCIVAKLTQTSHHPQWQKSSYVIVMVTCELHFWVYHLWGLQRLQQRSTTNRKWSAPRASAARLHNPHANAVAPQRFCSSASSLCEKIRTAHLDVALLDMRSIWPRINKNSYILIKKWWWMNAGGKELVHQQSSSLTASPCPLAQRTSLELW